MIDLAKLQKDAGPLWPTIDEALNDVRRAAASELQALHLSTADTLKAKEEAQATAAATKAAEAAAALQAKTEEAAQATAQAAELQTMLTTGVSDILAIIANPDTPTEQGIRDYIADKTRTAREKQIAELDGQIAQLTATRAALADAPGKTMDG